MAKIASFSLLFHLQSKSINFNSGHFSSKTKGYSLTFWPKLPHFHHFFISNQNQSISILVIFHQKPKVIALLFGQNCLIFTTFFISNQNQSISILVIFHQKPKVIALLFGQKLPHFHHFFISNQNQSISILVIFHQKPKVIALLLAKIASFSPLFHLQSKSINFNSGHFSSKTKGYSLTFWPKLPHFHHFFISNQNQSISILVMFHQKPKVIALLFGQNCLIFTTFSSPIKINQFQFWSFFIKTQRL